MEEQNQGPGSSLKRTGCDGLKSELALEGLGATLAGPSRAVPRDVWLAVRAGRVVLSVRRVLEQLGPVVLQHVGPGANALAMQRAYNTYTHDTIEHSCMNIP